MPLRRTVLAFVVALVCALAVFTLPRFAWNTVQAALRPQPASADTSGPVAAAAPAARGAAAATGPDVSAEAGCGRKAAWTVFQAKRGRVNTASAHTRATTKARTVRRSGI